MASGTLDWVRSEANHDVVPARPGEFLPVQVGPFSVWPPVVLAPMAGVTNAPFRTLCRQFGAGLYVSEMLTARAVIEGHRKTMKLAEFAPDEKPRSLQLYGIDPTHVGDAVRRLVDEGRADHIDLNFGCPVKKVTRHGGGAALPAKPRLLRAIIRAAVTAAGSVPVTMKTRVGVDDDHLTHLEAGRIAEGEGCAAVALHARTAAQLYSGHADWHRIGELKDVVTSIPVLGNGDIWESWDALVMMRETGCDGVVIGRGCLGRPWLFRDLAAVFDGQAPPEPPELGTIATMMITHARMLRDWLTEDDPPVRPTRGPGARTPAERGVRDFRKHTGWYLKGFPVGGARRRQLAQIDSVDELVDLLADLDPDIPFPPDALRLARGHTGGPQTVLLPPGHLDPDNDGPLDPAAESPTSGG